MAPPWSWHSVADPHAVATIGQGGTQATQTAFASIPAYDPISTIKANYFGKKILRMAGIVQMLHAHKPPYDKYPYAHPKRVRATQSARNQKGSRTSMASAIPGSCRTTRGVVTHRPYSSHHTCSIWLILHILLTLSVPSMRAYKLDSIEDSINSRA